MESADGTFKAFLGAILKARRAELKALSEPDNRDEWLVEADKHRADAMGFLAASLDYA